MNFFPSDIKGIVIVLTLEWYICCYYLCLFKKKKKKSGLDLVLAEQTLKVLQKGSFGYVGGDK